MKKALAVFLVVVALVGTVSSCGNDNWKEQEKAAFSKQLRKDPRSWTKEEAKRYNDFSKWLEKQ